MFVYFCLVSSTSVYFYLLISTVDLGVVMASYDSTTTLRISIAIVIVTLTTMQSQSFILDFDLAGVCMYVCIHTYIHAYIAVEDPTVNGTLTGHPHFTFLLSL